MNDIEACYQVLNQRDWIKEDFIPIDYLSISLLSFYEKNDVCKKMFNDFLSFYNGERSKPELQEYLV